MSWSVFGHDPRFFFDYTPYTRGQKRPSVTMDERERRGRFSRDECSVIATRGTSCSVPGNPRVSFVLPSPPPPPRAEQIGPDRSPGSVHYRCIAAHPSIELFDAASKQPRIPPSFAIYIDEYDALCASQRAVTRVNRVASIPSPSLSDSFSIEWTS